MLSLSKHSRLFWPPLTLRQAQDDTYAQSSEHLWWGHKRRRKRRAQHDKKDFRIFAPMTSLSDSGAIFAYHRAMIKKHGNNNAHTLGWREPEHQLLRFKVLAEVADLNGCSVLDAGCGHADLLPFLKQQYPTLGYYCGLEMMPELLDEAIQRYGHLPDTSFISGNFISRKLPLLDYILVCGSLNYSSANPNYIFEAIEKLYNNCSLGFAFNLLRHVAVEGILKAYNPTEIITFCQSLSHKVVLRDDYADEDFTVFMYK